MANFTGYMCSECNRWHDDVGKCPAINERVRKFLEAEKPLTLLEKIEIKAEILDAFDAITGLGYSGWKKQKRTQSIYLPGQLDEEIDQIRETNILESLIDGHDFSNCDGHESFTLAHKIKLRFKSMDREIKGSQSRIASLTMANRWLLNECFNLMKRYGPEEKRTLACQEFKKRKKRMYEPKTVYFEGGRRTGQTKVKNMILDELHADSYWEGRCNECGEKHEGVCRP